MAFKNILIAFVVLVTFTLSSAFVVNMAPTVASSSAKTIVGARGLSMVAVGEQAPDFELKDANGKSFKLSSLKGKKGACVFFYPKDDTPGCTTQACTFNESLAAFKKANVEVIGISSDADHTAFVNKYNLQMTMLSDVGGKVRAQYKVPKAAFGLLDGRVSYFIDKTGKVTGVYDNIGDAKGHVSKAKEAFGVK